MSNDLITLEVIEQIKDELNETRGIPEEEMRVIILEIIDSPSNNLTQEQRDKVLEWVEETYGIDI